MSSRKSQKKRSVSRSKPEKPNDYGPAENEGKKDGFLPMLAGMTLSLMLIFWIASLFNPQDQQEKLASAQNKKIDAATAAIQSTSFDQFLRDANPDQLVERLNELKSSDSRGVNATMVFECKQRVAVAKRILKTTSTDQYVTFAKLNWLMAERTIYGVDFIGRLNSPTAAEEFEECYQRFLNDTDPLVYREAHMARLSYYLFECVKGNQPVAALSKYLKDVLDRFPDEEEVAANIRLQFRACIESDREVAKQLAEEVLRSDSSKSKRASEFAQFILDNYQILKMNYSDMFANRFLNGDAGLMELEKASLMLLDNPESGNLIVDEVSKTVLWFERSRNFDRAQRVFQGMIDAGKRDRKNKAVEERLVAIGNAGIARIELLGKKIPISGTTITDKKVSETDFNNRIVLGVFFDPTDPTSTLLINAINRTASKYAKHGSPVRVIAVPSSADEFAAKVLGGAEGSRIYFFGWDNNRPPELINTYPVVNYPHLMALDHEGKLARINIDPARYEAEIQRLVDER